jgi:hypothetical protein
MRVTAWLVYTETSVAQKGLAAPVRADHAGEVVAVGAVPRNSDWRISYREMP